MAEVKLSKPSYLEDGVEAPKDSVTQGGDHQVKQVVSGKVKPVKKTAGKRFMESIGVEDGRTVGDYLVWDVIVPAMKDTISEVFKKGIDAFLYGGPQPGRGSDRRGRSGRATYNSYYDDRNRSTRRYSYNPRAVNDFREFAFDDRRDAELVLSEMCEIIDTYGFCKVSDFYSLVGETERDFTDHGYGWDHLGSAAIVRGRDGWIIDLPRPISLK